MPADELNLVDLLSHNPLFTLLGEQKLTELAADPRITIIRSGQIIFDTGDSCNGFFLIVSGKVLLEKDAEKGIETIAVLAHGDHFGSEVLDGSTRKRLTRATALTETRLMKFSRKDLRELSSGCTEFDQAVRLELKSFLFITRKRFPWRNEHENIIYINRKHPYFLFKSLVVPILTGVLLLIPLGLIYVMLLPNSVVIPILMLAELVISFFWSLWKGWDWTNDYYVITDQRVLNLEKVVLFYESRQETPLEAILSLDTDTSFSGRWMGFGTIRARTFTGSIQFRYIQNPEWVIALVQEYWSRAKSSQVNINKTEVEADIRSRLAGAKPAEAQLPVNPVASDIESGPLVTSLAGMFKLKEIQGESVIYRTHWWILIRRLILPMVFLILWVMTLAAAAGGFLGGLDIATFFSIILLGGLVLWIWFLYRIVDWRNDYYMITPDQIIDVHRRPLGAEEKRTAPLKNIQSIEYFRQGMLGILLNFGSVAIRIGDTDLNFDYVSDPSSVQKDLFERFINLTRREKGKEVRAERDRIADYIDTYHRMTGEGTSEPGKPPTPPDSE
jgi:uncharacterized membrane protein YdbT with pleckstrin-like domain